MRSVTTTLHRPRLPDVRHERPTRPTAPTTPPARPGRGAARGLRRAVAAAPAGIAMLAMVAAAGGAQATAAPGAAGMLPLPQGVLAANAAAPWSPHLVDAITQAARQALAAHPTAPSGPTRLDVQLGTLDPRLKLAPCQQVQAFWPAGQRLLGQARVGLRCQDGPTRWQVFLPVSIRVWGAALVAASDLPAGTVLAPEHLRPGEADLLARQDAVVRPGPFALGRALARPLAAGQPLRQGDLRLRQWIRPGDTVRVFAGTDGFQVSAEGEALAAALEGQPVRVRTEGGRVLQGVASGDRQVTVPL